MLDWKIRVAQEFVLGPKANNQKGHNLNPGLTPPDNLLGIVLH